MFWKCVTTELQMQSCRFTKGRAIKFDILMYVILSGTLQARYTQHHVRLRVERANTQCFTYLLDKQSNDPKPCSFLDLHLLLQPHQHYLRGTWPIAPFRVACPDRYSDTTKRGLPPEAQCQKTQICLIDANSRLRKHGMET